MCMCLLTPTSAAQFFEQLNDLRIFKVIFCVLFDMDRERNFDYEKLGHTPWADGIA